MSKFENISYEKFYEKFNYEKFDEKFNFLNLRHLFQDKFHDN